MSMLSALAGVGRSNAIPSLPESLFREYSAGRIGKDEYEMANAVWVAEHASEYHARRYPVLSQKLLDYARGRMAEAIPERGELENRQIGLWLQTVISLMQQNSADRELLVWCLDRVRSKDLRNHVFMIDQRLAQFEIPYPANISLIGDNQKKDAQQKAYRERGR